MGNSECSRSRRVSNTLLTRIRAGMFYFVSSIASCSIIDIYFRVGIQSPESRVKFPRPFTGDFPKLPNVMANPVCNVMI